MEMLPLWKKSCFTAIAPGEAEAAATKSNENPATRLAAQQSIL